jgi:hypothetical protein
MGTGWSGRAGPRRRGAQRAQATWSGRAAAAARAHLPLLPLEARPDVCCCDEAPRRLRLRPRCHLRAPPAHRGPLSGGGGAAPPAARRAQPPSSSGRGSRTAMGTHMVGPPAAAHGADRPAVARCCARLGLARPPRDHLEQRGLLVDQPEEPQPAQQGAGAGRRFVAGCARSATARRLRARAAAPAAQQPRRVPARPRRRTCRWRPA